MPLDAESSALTTFITPWGAYRFIRNVMGLMSAGDEHNRRGDDALQGVQNVQKVVEDVLIYHIDLDTHVQRAPNFHHPSLMATLHHFHQP